MSHWPRMVCLGFLSKPNMTNPTPIDAPAEQPPEQTPGLHKAAVAQAQARAAVAQRQAELAAELRGEAVDAQP